MVDQLPRAAHERVVLAAPVSVSYQRKTDQPASYFIGTALRRMLEQAAIEKSACDGLMVSSFSMAPDSVAALSDIFGMSLNWIEQVPLGGAAGVVGLRRAARAIESGDAEVIACIGGDTFSPEAFGKLLSGFSDFTADAVTPYASGGANLPFAMLTRKYMDDYQAKREDFGRLCILQRQNAMRYEQAMLREELTMEAYLAARPIAEPLTLFDCPMPCAGAEGFLLMSDTTARKLDIPYVHLRASGERHNAARGACLPLNLGWRDFQADLYDAAGFGPSEIDIVQVYDDYPVMAMLQIEDLGICKAGESAASLSADGFLPGGRRVHLNTSGGQLSAGQAGFAGGFLGLVDAIRQLTDTALGNQVSDARTALVSGFGMINYDRGLCTSAAILERSK